MEKKKTETDQIFKKWPNILETNLKLQGAIKAQHLPQKFEATAYTHIIVVKNTTQGNKSLVVSEKVERASRMHLLLEGFMGKFTLSQVTFDAFSFFLQFSQI